MEDMILPDDFVEDTTPNETLEETQEETTDTLEPEVEETKPTEEPTEPVEPQKIKIKFNKEEQELTVEEAAALAQKGMNYEKAVERAAQDGRDAAIADMGYEWNGKPIKTEAEYKQAIAEKELMEKYQDVPEEVRNELMENRRFREKYEAEQKAKTEQEAKDADLKGFIDYFQSVNDRPFDPTKDTIPKEVWEANSKGTPLRFAYMEHRNKELQGQLKVFKQNESNKQKAPVGSLTAHGGAEPTVEDDFIKGFNSI